MTISRDFKWLFLQIILGNYGCFTGEGALKAPQTTIVDIVFLIENVCVAAVLLDSFLFLRFSFNMVNYAGSDLGTDIVSF